jgi:hypothetical protein
MREAVRPSVSLVGCDTLANTSVVNEANEHNSSAQIRALGKQSLDPRWFRLSRSHGAP